MSLAHELRPIVDLNDLGRELKALDAMNKSGLWLTRMSSGHELRALNAISNSWLLMT